MAESIPPALQPPVAVALAKLVKSIPRPNALPGGAFFEPKWDGFRAMVRPSLPPPAQIPARQTRPRPHHGRTAPADQRPVSAKPRVGRVMPIVVRWSLRTAQSCPHSGITRLVVPLLQYWFRRNLQRMQLRMVPLFIGVSIRIYVLRLCYGTGASCRAARAVCAPGRPDRANRGRARF
jgi:hypothetical protein